MNKKLLKVAVTAAVTAAFAVPAFANPFSDVEQNHWAYDAVESLAEAGIVEGYGDDTFKGEQNITRYEMAQIVAKAMGQDLSGEHKATVDKLAREFSEELSSMGVAIEDLQAEQERVKISGDARVRYAAIDNHGDDSDFRARVTVDGKIDDNLKFNTRISSGNIGYDKSNEEAIFDTANLGFSVWGLDNTVGRHDLYLGNGMIMDDTINGITSEIGDLKVFLGNQTDTEERVYGAEYNVDVLNGLKLNYMKADVDAGDDKEFYGANTSVNIAKNVSLNAEYAKENKSGDDAMAYGISFDKIGFSAMYKDVEKGAHTAYSTAGGDLNNVSFMKEDGYKGMEYKLAREVANNTILTISYQDFENQSGTQSQDRTSATLNISF